MDPVTGAIVMGAGSALGSLKKDEGAALGRNYLKLAQQQFAEREPLRAMGLSRLQMPLPERPDQSAAFADPSNPFAVTPQAVGFGAGYSNQPPDLGTSLDKYRGLALGPYGKESLAAQRGNTGIVNDTLDDFGVSWMGREPRNPISDMRRR